MSNQQILSGLARAKVAFQLRAIQAAMGIGDCLEQCAVCGDYHGERDVVPFTCQTGDGV